MTSQIEKISLEAHVEIDEQRHRELQNQIDHLRESLERVYTDMDEIRDDVVASNDARQKQIITIAGTIIGILLSALIGTLLQLIK